MGFKIWGLRQIGGYLFLRFLEFPGAAWALRKRALKMFRGEEVQTQTSSLWCLTKTCART